MSLFGYTNDARLCNPPDDVGFKPEPEMALQCVKRGCCDVQDAGNKRGMCWDCYQSWRDKMDSYMEGE